MRSCEPWVEGTSLILFKLLNKCVFHLSEERSIELVPFGCLEVSLLQHRRFAKDVYRGTNIEIPAGQLCCVSFISTIKFFYIVFRVLNNDLVRLAVEAEDNNDIVLLAILNPPRGELQALNLIYNASKITG